MHIERSYQAPRCDRFGLGLVPMPKLAPAWVVDAGDPLAEETDTPNDRVTIWLYTASPIMLRRLGKTSRKGEADWIRFHDL